MVRSFPYVMAEVGEGDFWLSGIDTESGCRIWHYAEEDTTRRTS
jgi:hypothetical protein